MKTDYLSIDKVFSSGGNVHYILPHFQRHYSWDEKNWKTLLDDALAVYEEAELEENGELDFERLPEHFLGSLVIIEDGLKSGNITALKLVDGQQRLTTVSLLLCALRYLVKDTHAELSQNIRPLLVNNTKHELLHFKLLPTTKYDDRTAYTSIIEQGFSDNPISKIPRAYEYLKTQLSQKILSGLIEPERLFQILSHSFQVVFINLSRSESPYKIFESLNAKGIPLTQGDLVRNYIAMRLPGSSQEEVFNKSWAEIDDLLKEERKVGKLGELTAFLRHYLAVDSSVLCNEEHVYARFRDFMQKNFKNDNTFIEQLGVLKRFAKYYDKLLRPEKDVNAELLKRLNTLEISTAYPFLLAAYDAQEQNIISSAQLKELLQVLENYMVRRYIAGESSSYLNKMFPTLWKEVSIGDFSASLRAVLSNKTYPPNRKIQEALLNRSFYSSSGREKTVLILESIEQRLWQGTGAIVKLDGKASLEHIMPQNISNIQQWQEALGTNWRQLHNDTLHLLGNLTLVTQEWNSGLSNRPFAGVDGKKVKLAGNGLRLNSQYFSSIEQWNEAAIQERAKFLAEKIIEIWPSFGTSTKVASATLYTVPQVVTIDGKTFEVESWRDVLHKTADYLVGMGRFEAMQKEAPTYFKENSPDKEGDRRYRKLSNGLLIYVRLSGDTITELCYRLVHAAGLNKASWNVQIKQIANQSATYKK